MASIAEILMEQGRQAAENRRAQGQNTAQLFSNLGAIAAAVPGQMQQATKNAQENTARGLEVKQLQDRDKSEAVFESALKDPANYKPDGTVDDSKISDTLRKNDVGAWEHWNTISAATAKNRLEMQKLGLDIQNSAMSAQEKQQAIQKAKQDYLGSIALHASKTLDQNPNDPLHARDTMLASVARAITDGAASEQEGKNVLMQTASATPDQLKQVFESVITPAARQQGEKDYADNAAKMAAAAKDLRPEKAPAPSAAEDDQKYENILVKQKISPKLVTAEDKAFLDAYNQRKTVTTDAATLAANDRAAKSQQQAVDQQKRAQDFQVAKEARGELANKVEAPYLTARTSADTLRDVVDAAQKGNKVAGSLQSLEATMGAIRAQGLNRINGTEIGVTANAGNMYDRLTGWLGKATEGQPVPADIQKDMKDFADILDKAAYKKYSDQFDSVAKFYDLNDQQKSLKMPPPKGSAPSGPTVGEQRMVKGQIAEWDGKGWKAVVPK